MTRRPRSRATTADGGLVSNLPVWCFSEEKAAADAGDHSEAIPIVAFTLRDPAS